MELPYGFENRHNTAVDPTAVVFSKKVVAREVTQEVRDEAVRQKYLSMSLPVGSKDTGNNGGPTSKGSAAAAAVPLPIGWTSRTATSAELTSPAAVQVNWSTLVEVPEATTTTDSGGGGGGSGGNRTAAASRNEVSASDNSNAGGGGGGGGYQGGGIADSADDAFRRSSAESTAKIPVAAPAPTSGAEANDNQSGSGGKQRTEMARVVLRLHQIEQEAAALVAERQALLRKLSMMIATSK